MNLKQTKQPVETLDKHATLKKEGLHLLVKLTFIILVITGVFSFVFGWTKVSDDTMSSALRQGDVLLYYRLDKDILAGDVVVIEINDDLQVRRVVATSGDRVDITEDGLMINGALQFEPSIINETLPYVEGIVFPLTLKKDEVFLLADKRTGAQDSRNYGAIKIQHIKGKVIHLVRRNNI